MSSLKSAVDKIIYIFDHILCALGVICYMTFVVSVLVQVISRNFLPSAPSWTEEMARYSFIYMVAFGCGVAVHRNEFVNVEFLHDALEKHHANINRIIALVIQVVLCIFTAYMLFTSVMPFAFIKFPMYSTAMEIPMQYVYFGIVLLFSFFPIAYALEIVSTLLHWNDKKEGEN